METLTFTPQRVLRSLRVIKFLQCHQYLTATDEDMPFFGKNTASATVFYPYLYSVPSLSPHFSYRY